MELLVNDRSLAGQFHSIDDFRAAFGTLMRMREIGRRYGYQIFCDRRIVHAHVTPQLRMVQAVQQFGHDERRSILQWLTQGGPFWDDDRSHGVGDYLECNGEVVTDTAIGEAAFCTFHETESHLTSLAPSVWNFTPLDVSWVLDSQNRRWIRVSNYWDPALLETALSLLEVPIESWGALRDRCTARFTHLHFSENAFSPLSGHPFAYGAARRILALLGVLDRLRQCFNEEGLRTAEGDELHQNHFTGEKAWFSDSSDSEKVDFKNELTFAHPEDANQRLFCGWHGKIKTPQFRIHFSTPIRFDVPLYVVYVGPKITKR